MLSSLPGGSAGFVPRGWTSGKHALASERHEPGDRSVRPLDSAQGVVGYDQSVDSATSLSVRHALRNP